MVRVKVQYNITYTEKKLEAHKEVSVKMMF